MSDKELIGIVTIHKYVRKVEVSKARQATYYEQGEKLPSKYASRVGADYMWVKFSNLPKPLLCNYKQEPVVKNPDAVGKPKYKLINGSDLHALTMKDYQRKKIVDAIKAQFIPEIEKLPIITTFPIRILAELYNTYEDVELGTNGNWDIDNHFSFYQKVFQDVLSGSLMKDKKTGKLVCTSKRIIPNDHRGFITQPPTPLFYPIENAEERKIVFKIYHDKREILKESRFYDNSTK